MLRHGWRPGLILALIVAFSAAAPGAGLETGAFDFREVSRELGLDFRHHHGGAGKRNMVETMVGGVVLFDYDQDGDQDAFFVDGAALPGYQGNAPKSRLLRNDKGRIFVDVTDRAGLQLDSYGCGSSAADFDGDGDLDLYVTALGPNSLWENLGNGRFRDVTVPAGVGDPSWSMSSAWADVDRDGDLDLYVTNYVDFEVGDGVRCHDEATGLERYCNPSAYRGQRDTLYLNLGGGRFADATVDSGLGELAEAGMGVVFADLDDDGWVDLYLTNDTHPNRLFINRGDGTFDDFSLLSGAALSDTGKAEAGMGVDAGDVDGDGRLDLIATNFSHETNALYRNQGGGLFLDVRFAARIAEASLLSLGFGVALADLDQDTDLDLVVANGHVFDNADRISSGVSHAQVNHLFENQGGRFSLIDDAFSEVRVSRGLALADLEGDGDLDLVFSTNDGVAEVYRNDGQHGGWLQVDLEAPGANPTAIGARLRVTTAGPASLNREVRAGSSYLSQSATTVHYGIADAERVDVEVRWPDGKRQRLAQIPTNRRVKLTRRH